jgi:2-C-methyl-D-erythritol 4-phosphate cytidylyltransferase
MTTRAVIFAGGTGQRMSTRSVPKQFLELHGKPVIVYTIEHFEKHPDVDDVVVVCLPEWIDDLRNLLERYRIRKVSRIVAGGDTGDESIYNGLLALQGVAHDDDIVLIHDGVRPLIDADLITANIKAATEHGSAITVEAVTESVVQVGSDGRVERVPPRSEMFLAKAPQTFRYGLIWDLYDWAHQAGQHSIDSAHLCAMRGLAPHTVASTSHNVKITHPLDFYVFRALFDAIENQQIMGV